MLIYDTIKNIFNIVEKITLMEKITKKTNKNII